jgi:hypothetical protein
MKTTIILAPTLELATQVNPHISVEAEYGDTAVQGSRYTAAHHGSRSSNPCPCVDAGIPLAGEGDTILVSHVDLDTVGGVGRALGHPACGGRHGMFWRLAAFIDTAGPHKMAEARRWDVAPAYRIERELHAYWAWAQANRGPQRARDVTHDVTEEIKRHLNVLLDIFGEGENGSLLTAGDEFKAAGEALNAESFRDLRQGVITRVSDAFVNHLYTTPEGEVAEAVVAFSAKTKAVTLSFAEKDDPRNAAEIMKEAFGPEAGGHKGIAGSPRGKELDEDAIAVVLSHIPGFDWEADKDRMDFMSTRA